MRTELFRPEAVAAHAEAAAAGRSLPSSRRMLTQAASALAIAILLGLGISDVVKVDETTEGTWSTTLSSTVFVYVPVGALNRVEDGQAVRLSDPGATGRVIGQARPIPGPDGEPPRALVPVTIEEGTVPPNGNGKAVVVLDRRSVLDLVVDAFGRGFRRG